METIICCLNKPILTHGNQEKCIKSIRIDSKRIHFYIANKYAYLKVFSEKVLYIIDLNEVFLNGSLISGIMMGKHKCENCIICKNKKFCIKLNGLFTAMEFTSKCISITCISNKKKILEMDSDQMIFLLKHTHHLFKNHFLKNSKTFQFENNRMKLNKIITLIIDILGEKQDIGESL